MKRARTLHDEIAKHGPACMRGDVDTMVQWKMREIGLRAEAYRLYGGSVPPEVTAMLAKRCTMPPCTCCGETRTGALMP